MIEHVHLHMTERFIVKRKSKGKLRSPINVNFSSLPSKSEPDDEFNELGEVPFNILIEDTLDEPSKTVAKAAAIALGADPHKDDNETLGIKRRRGRPKKEQIELEICQKRSKDKNNKTEEEQDAYKAK
ncbi:hypothetical protein EVAR_70697_1 [Eumeta japonica]|uniref:Uncharacterized protein n=1 Tax=Eumeta variegata TaxID=151549 RepID=A0A4C2ADI0_EUMVA|nr:hypothetical protein EVAR_70697_1 [Eumeta japonica]